MCAPAFLFLFFKVFMLLVSYMELIIVILIKGLGASGTGYLV